MKKEDCKKGMKVVLGKPFGKNILCEIIKINPKTIKVRALDTGNPPSIGARPLAGGLNIDCRLCEKAEVSKMPAPTDHLTAYYKSLIGATVTGYAMSDDGFPVFTYKFPNGVTGEVEVSMDEEGNGGGFLFGLPVPTKVKGGWEPSSPMKNNKVDQGRKERVDYSKMSLRELTIGLYESGGCSKEFYDTTIAKLDAANEA